MPLWLSITLIAAALSAALYNKRPAKTPAPPETEREVPKPLVIKPNELEALLQSQPNQVILLDVRGRKEYLKGQKIDGALNIPLAFIMYRIKNIPREKTVVALCASGNRSLTASTLLMMQNYPKVLTLEGGMHAWLAYKNIAKQAGCG